MTEKLYYTPQQVAKRLHVCPASYSRCIRENPSAAIAAVMNFGAIISGDTVKFPANNFDKKMIELGLEPIESRNERNQTHATT